MRRVKVRVHKGRVVSPPEADRRREMLGETNRAYALLKADPEAWKEERKEHAGRNRCFGHSGDASGGNEYGVPLAGLARRALRLRRPFGVMSAGRAAETTLWRVR